jgi:hypothetical protein
MMILFSLLQVVFFNFVVVCSGNVESESDTSVSSESVLKEIENDLERVSLIGHQLSRDLDRLDRNPPPLPGQRAREPAASVLNLIRSFFHLLESVTGQARIEGDEVDQIVKEFNRLLYTATRFFNGDPEQANKNPRKGRTFQEYDPHYQKIREVVKRVMVRRGMNTGTPSSPTKACDCNQIKIRTQSESSSTVATPTVISPPLTSTILVAGASPSTPVTGISLAQRQPRALGLEMDASVILKSGPWITGDGFLKENAIETTTVPTTTTTEGPPTPPPIIAEVEEAEEEVVPSIQPVSNATEVPLEESTTSSPVSIPLTNITMPEFPGIPGINWATSGDPFSSLLTVMREYANIMNLMNQRVANVTAQASKIVQTSARIVSGQLRVNDTTWVYGQPMIKATEGYVEIMQSLASQLTVLGQQFANLRQLLSFSG